MSLDGSNPRNLTANDERLYTSVVALPTLNVLLVGYEEGGVEQIALFDSSNNVVTPVTEGSDPDFFRTATLTEAQLEGFADAGLVQACTLVFDFGDEVVVEVPKSVRSEPRDDAPVVRSMNPFDRIQVNAFLPAANSNEAGWYRLTDGTWIKDYRLTAEGDCPPLPIINRNSLGL